MLIRVQKEAFDFSAEVENFTQKQRGMGAIVTFSGIVRDTPDGDLKYMEIEHYPGMTQAALTDFAQTALDRWSLGDALVIHRYGSLKPNDMIMMVATAARHRVAAFEAAEYLMDYLKSRAPFWKKELKQDGAIWVEAKDHDETALNRW